MNSNVWVWNMLANVEEKEEEEDLFLNTRNENFYSIQALKYFSRMYIRLCRRMCVC